MRGDFFPPDVRCVSSLRGREGRCDRNVLSLVALAQGARVRFPPNGILFRVADCMYTSSAFLRLSAFDADVNMCGRRPPAPAIGVPLRQDD